MFENLLYQNVALSLSADIENDCLPGALLFAGPASTGKLTGALELARVLSCVGTDRGIWTCNCFSCQQHKALVNPQLILTGPRDCSPEISAAKRSFLRAVSSGLSYVNATRYLFIRSIRKLTLRFSEILWQSDTKLPKIATFMEAINDDLEFLDPVRELPKMEKLTKLCDSLESNCRKLEDTFMYDSLPVQQIRNISLWARMTSQKGKKVVIIENADRMFESVRNALLKILEEPPTDTVFVLTTCIRGAVMPTILSRVRTYTFTERTGKQQKDIINRIFHDSVQTDSIEAYLRSFLSVQQDSIRKYAEDFFDTIVSGGIPDVQVIVKACGAFNPRILLKIFLEELLLKQRPFLCSAAGTEASSKMVEAVRTCWTNVVTYNLSPAASLEQLVRSIAYINRSCGGLLHARIC